MSSYQTNLTEAEIAALVEDAQAMACRVQRILEIAHAPGSVIAQDVMQKLDSLESYVRGALASLRYSGEVQL